MNEKKPNLIIMCGIARSGKSSWINKFKTDGCIIVSPDEIRKEIFGHQFHALANSFVFGVAEGMVSLLLKQGVDVVVDATHTTSGSRAKWRNIALNNNAEVMVASIFSERNPVINFMQILERNYFSPKKQQVPVDVLLRMASTFDAPYPDLEGNWFTVQEYKIRHLSKFASEDRIAVGVDDTLESYAEKWRSKWDAVTNREKNL